jgi:2,5-diamino-6-(ribosylamino)-4(3H)-pyrimidinone 5'-phosphate reductase
MNRPYVTINVAMTADGKIDTYERQGTKISSEQDWERVDKLRSENDAVMVGGNTLINEDPKLTIKSPTLRADRGTRGLNENPIKVGVISNASLLESSRFIHEGATRVILCTTHQTSPNQIRHLQNFGVEVLCFGETRVNLPIMMDSLSKNGISRILVEGGGTLNSALIQEKLVDEIIIYLSPMIFAGGNSPTLADGFGLSREDAIHLKSVSFVQLENDGVILHYQVIN